MNSDDIYDIKVSGTKCTVKEARKFYADVFLQAQADALKILLYSVENFKQNIPVSKMDAGTLEKILDDCKYVGTKFNTFGEVLKLLYDLYKNPNDYNAWCGMVDEQLVYYVEKKNRLQNNLGGMFV